MKGERRNLLGLSRAQLEDFFAGLGEKPYRARQLMKWIYRRGEADFDQMSDISKV
ncbi:MAG: 23S rRNA (adenine(2503)-C(2))-methyltransferase RlmN, partial [Gammaproteobacteria bacterium]